MACGAMPASDESVAICRQKDIDISSHRSRPLDCEEAETSDFIFAMSRSHERLIRELCPKVARRCMLLDTGGDVADPIGGGFAVYGECAKQIEKALRKRISEIWHEDSGSK
jgi:protein-tyrosine-phosphatase